MRRVVVVLAVLSLVAGGVGGCGGGGKDKKADSASRSTSTTSSSTTSSSTTTAPSGPNATGTGKGATAAANAKPATGTSGSGSGTGRGSGGSATSTKGVQPAAPGQYTYNRTGKATTSAFGEQSMDGQITARFDPVANGEQHSAQQAPEGSTEQSLRFLSEGAYFTLLKQATSGFTKEFRPNPAVLALPASPSPSSPWSWTVTSTDGKTTLNAAFKVLRNESVAIGGESVPTVVLSVQLKASGDITFTQNATDWVAMAKGLIVKNEQTTDGSLGGVTFHSQSSQVLQSTKPA